MKTPEITPSVVKYLKINSDCPAIKHPMRRRPDVIKTPPPMINGQEIISSRRSTKDAFLFVAASILSIVVGMGFTKYWRPNNTSVAGGQNRDAGLVLKPDALSAEYCEKKLGRSANKEKLKACITTFEEGAASAARAILN